MVHSIHADIFTTDCQVIAHGCNCKGAFGSGVAKLMAKHHPLAQKMYFEKFKTEGWRLGDAQFVPSKGKVIVNCGTQKQYGNAAKTGVRYCDYDAIRESLLKVKDYAKANNLKVAIPKIGAGLAGGDWKVIKKIIEQVFNDYEVYVYIYK